MTKSILSAIILCWLFTNAIGQHNGKDPNLEDANEYMHQSSHEEMARIFDSEKRDEWQKPDAVIAFLGDIEDKSIVDVGSGSGYFALRLALAGARVIAADVDLTFLNMIKGKSATYDIDEKNLTTLQIKENELNIDENSADIVFLVNVYHHITDRVEYFAKVNSKLKENGKIVIVDFYKESLPVGPPKNHKLSKDEVINELNKAGYNDLNINTELLEYQYIITAHKF